MSKLLDEKKKIKEQDDEIETKDNDEIEDDEKEVDEATKDKNGKYPFEKGYVKETDEDEEEVSEKKKKSKKESYLEDEQPPVKDVKDSDEKIVKKIEESVNTLLDGENLSEDFKSNISTLIETVVKEKCKAESKKIKKEAEEKAEKDLEDEVEEVTEKVDMYLSKVVTEWAKENKVALENSLKVELAENFIHSLKTLFNENNIEINDEQSSLVEQLQKKVDGLEDKLDESIKENIKLKSEMISEKSLAIFENVSKDLADTDKERFKNLIEDVSVENLEAFEKKIKVIKESVFSKESKNKSENINETFDDSNSDDLTKSVNAVLMGKRTF